MVKNAAIVRFGQTFYVVPNTKGATISEKKARETAIGAFPFEGQAVRSNYSCGNAYVLATALARVAVTK